MSEIKIYWIVIIFYMFIVIGIGLIASRRTRGISDFYLGGRNIGPFVTALSFIAAYFSSVVIIGGGGFGYKFGMSTLWVGAINVLLGCTLCWIFLGKRLRKYTQKFGTMTIPGFISERFKAPETRFFLAIVIFIFMIIYNVSVLKGMGHIFEVLMKIPYIYGILISGTIIILYVTIGGYVAVVWTSFIQALIMIVGLFLLTSKSLIAVGGLTAVNERLAAIDPGLLSTPGVWGYAGLISYCLIVSFGVWGMPQLVIRFYSIRNTAVLRIGTIVVTIGGCLALLPYLNGAISRILSPNLTNPDLAIPTLTKLVLSPLGAAIFLAAVIAAGMSTFSAVLIIVSSAIVRDFWQKGLKKQTSEKKLLRAGRVVSAVAGIISLLIAFKPPGLVLVLTAFSWAIIASATLWPILFAIYWRRTTRWGVTISMFAGSSVALIWMVIGKPFGIHGFIPGIIVGLILIIVVSLLTKPPSKEITRKIWED
ncbi:sodium/proline symporter [candidate division WOR-3 bacterium]|nr:sodium/proline symporter [candidate division WOR-3 bacterium]MCK4576033.1 sodium/proline symporter [candidate division WOR-3 bacterium]